ncbi:MAG: S-layer homology domain-containing protein [Clostridia bacterium]|nr:S-layer homology domain-containing protein [Clostridia bacterium]
MAQVIYNLIKDYSETKEDVSILSDIKGKPYEKAARKLISLGIIKGYDDNSFHGDNILTRAEAVTIINRTLKSLGIKSNIKSLSNNFNDLDKTH